MGLSNKQQTFVNEYLKCWNASEAARLAKYKGRPNTVGPRLLANVGIAEEIKRRIEKNAMAADEVLARMALIARSSMADFVRVIDGANVPLIDWEKAAAAGALDNLKKIVIKDGEISFELHDKQAALVHMGRHLGLWNRLEITGANGGPVVIAVTKMDVDEL